MLPKKGKFANLNFIPKNANKSHKNSFRQGGYQENMRIK